MAPEFLREIPGPMGPLEALLDLPDGEPTAVAVFGHPHPLHGGTMHTKALYQAAKALPRIGAAALRFNFRGVGRSAGTFDSGQGEKDDFKAAIDFAVERYPGLPVWAIGMSFGSWVAMTTGAEDPRVSLLLGIAPPVDRYQFDALKTCTLPKFIIHGEDDELISIKEVRKFYGQIPEPKEMITIEDANHLFEMKTSLVGDAVEGLLADVARPQK
ncbi:MAG: alpha/beta hydrolase [Acidobacterium sp.]|nr:alpha/beta hydrolase [Acidobacteriota bacterium]PHY10816.1 MAG: alpha/beta hydrolase [Acidobacterium sp.]